MVINFSDLSLYLLSYKFYEIVVLVTNNKKKLISKVKQCFLSCFLQQFLYVEKLCLVVKIYLLILIFFNYIIQKPIAFNISKYKT